MGPFIGAIIVSLINGCIWGAATYTINDNKGYYNNGFWWGFWLGIFGLLVVLCKPDNHTYYPTSRNNAGDGDKLPPITGPQTVPAGGWKCSCGRAHPAYISSCVCGKSKHDAPFPSNTKETTCNSQTVPFNSSNDSNTQNEEINIAIIKKYKDLLDSGAITQEEFDAKKKQLLGL